MRRRQAATAVVHLLDRMLKTCVKHALNYRNCLILAGSALPGVFCGFFSAFFIGCFHRRRVCRQLIKPALCGVLDVHVIFGAAVPVGI
jgi:hypothetical protein